MLPRELHSEEHEILRAQLGRFEIMDPIARELGLA